MGHHIAVSETPDPADRAPIAAGLDAFNDARVGAEPIRPLAVLVRDDAGRVVGGLWGWSYYGWLYVEMLFVPESLRGRGVGTGVLRAAETAAAARGCRGVWLDTFTFQAPGFYERLGYAVLGTIADYPPGHGRLILTKRLADRAPGAGSRRPVVPPG